MSYYLVIFIILFIGIAIFLYFFLELNVFSLFEEDEEKEYKKANELYQKHKLKQLAKIKKLHLERQKASDLTPTEEYKIVGVCPPVGKWSRKIFLEDLEGLVQFLSKFKLYNPKNTKMPGFWQRTIETRKRRFIGKSRGRSR